MRALYCCYRPPFNIIVRILYTPTDQTAHFLNRSATPTSGSGKKDTIYDRLPGSLKAEVLVKVKDTDPEKTKERQELIRSKTPNELSQITSLGEFPVPSPIQNLFGGRYAIIYEQASQVP